MAPDAFSWCLGARLEEWGREAADLAAPEVASWQREKSKRASEVQYYTVVQLQFCEVKDPKTKGHSRRKKSSSDQHLNCLMEWDRKRVWEKENECRKGCLHECRGGAGTQVYVDHMSGVKKGNDSYLH
ncbi:hypothetical protein BC827DRAFT_1153917 [Russula dissimulans]|nr:hypothetical protein BC827DRAFT_1153917 [Russula dissimulans]